MMRTVSAGLGDETLTSDPSERVSFLPVGLPLPPTDLSATVGDGSAVINFTNTDPNNGARLLNTIVSVDGGAFTPLSPADTSGPIVVTGLTNGQAHTIALKTQTSVGLVQPRVTSLSRQSRGPRHPMRPPMFSSRPTTKKSR